MVVRSEFMRTNRGTRTARKEEEVNGGQGQKVGTVEQRRGKIEKIRGEKMRRRKYNYEKIRNQMEGGAEVWNEPRRGR